MKTLQELDLHVPHLGVKQTRQAIGGYGGYSGWGYCFDYWDDSDYDLNPVYCVADRDSFKSHNDYSDISSLSYAHAYDGYSSGGGSYPGIGVIRGISCTGEVDHDGYYLDSSISRDDRDIINDAMECLPEEFLRYDTMIVTDSALLALMDGKVNGCFLFKGQVVHLKNGSTYIADQDMVLIKDIKDLSGTSLRNALEEEFWHNWQHETCMRGDNTPLSNPTKESMELQQALINWIDNAANCTGMFSSSESMDTLIGIISDYAFDVNKSGMVDALNSISPNQWNIISQEWAENPNRGPIDTSYNWNWEEMIDILFQ